MPEKVRVRTEQVEGFRQLQRRIFIRAGQVPSQAGAGVENRRIPFELLVDPCKLVALEIQQQPIARSAPQTTGREPAHLAGMRRIANA